MVAGPARRDPLGRAGLREGTDAVSICVMLRFCLTLVMCRVAAGLEVNPAHPSLLFVRAKVLWEEPQRDKSEAYSALLQVRVGVRYVVLIDFVFVFFTGSKS